jgi:DNA-binding MarR family transcriptional regulator
VVVSRTALPVLRAFARIAEESLAEVAPSVTLQQFRALNVLHERGPQNASSLAEALGIAPSTLTRLSDRLVRDGLIDRVPDADDRRAVVLSATRRGTQIADQVKAWRLRALTRAFEGITDRECAELSSAFRRAGDLFAAGEE